MLSHCQHFILPAFVVNWLHVRWSRYHLRIRTPILTTLGNQPLKIFLVPSEDILLTASEIGMHLAR